VDSTVLICGKKCSKESQIQDTTTLQRQNPYLELCLYLVEFCGEIEGLEPPPGDRGGNGGVMDEMLSLRVEFVPAGGTG
jgi:hypothetical protein